MRGEQLNLSKLGKYNKGKAEKSVHDYLKENKVKWNARMTTPA